jgi:hypothetical protein
LGQFSGTPGVQKVPCHPENVSEITELFFGDQFFHMLSDFQNRDKYDRSYKVLKWVDVTLAKMKNLFAIIILMGQVKKDMLKD